MIKKDIKTLKEFFGTEECETAFVSAFKTLRMYNTNSHKKTIVIVTPTMKDEYEKIWYTTQMFESAPKASKQEKYERDGNYVYVYEWEK